MSNERQIILCGGAEARRGRANKVTRLNLHGPDANVTLRLTDLSDAFLKVLPDHLIDLLDIAAYVYAADQSCSRGSEVDLGERWPRDFVFHIPVRSIGLWTRPDVMTGLVNVLTCLSGDSFEFCFTSMTSDVPRQNYLTGISMKLAVDEVILFSGGLDSLAGALHELAEGRDVALVSHSSATKRIPLVQKLVAELRQRFPQRRIRHIPVLATKRAAIRAEFTQRTRSFLYACLATVVAELAGRDRIRFYENGVTSMNLPIAPQVIGTRATRTTHPESIHCLAAYFSAVLGRAFQVEIPFFWRTKTGVVRYIREKGCARLIRGTVSCSRTIEASTEHPHCGRCSQCVDRRFAMLAAGISDEDEPPDQYKLDLLIGPRELGEDRTLVALFADRARKLACMPDHEFFIQFSEAFRAVRHLDGPADLATSRLVDLHRQHGHDVLQALERGRERYGAELESGTLPDTCLLALTFPRRYQQLDIPRDSRFPSFKPEGDGWRVWFEAETVIVKDTVGVRHIERLVSTPWAEWHVLKLQSAENPPGTSQPAPPSPQSTIDRAARRSYEREIERLDEGIEAARQGGDAQTAIELAEERKKIAKHLASETTPGGKAKRMKDAGELARQSVSKAINTARGHMLGRHRLLGVHLNRYVKLGYRCIYTPPMMEKKVPLPAVGT